MIRLARGIAAIGAGLGLALALGPASATASTGPGWQIVNTAIRGTLISVSAIGPGDAWAAGQVVLHETGSHWTQVPVRLPPQFGYAIVAASSPSNVWLFGTSILRFDGRGWRQVPAPGGAVEGAGQVPPVVIAANDVWGFGVQGGQRNSCLTLLWHWNGIRWTAHDLRRFCGTGIAASSWHSVWIVGTSSLAATSAVYAYRWGGATWRAVSMPHPKSGSLASMPDITAVTVNNVWVGVPAGDVPPSASALHWNGHSWSTTPKTALASWDGVTGGIASDGHNGVWLGPNTHWTGTTWADASPADSAANLQAITLVPGTGSMLAAGGEHFRCIVGSYG